MENSTVELEERAAAIRERQIAAAVIFMIAFPGTVCNGLVATFTRTVPTLNNPFGRLTASQASGETVICALFAFYYVPMVALDIQPMKEFSKYIGIILLICYDICIFSHLIIALNRMSAIFFPLSYSVYFSDRNTTAIIVVIWTVSITVPFVVHGRGSCSFTYSDAIYTYVFGSNESCGGMWYADFIQDVIIVIVIAIIDITTIVKYRLSSAQIIKCSSQMTRRNLDKKLLKQTVAQGIVFAVELSTYFFLGWLFQNKWVIWSLTTVAWNIVHFSDAYDATYSKKQTSDQKEIPMETE